MRFSRASLVAAAVTSALFIAGPAPAQTAADKATAREAATEGIKLYRAGNYADALDRLRRAQALYDAPVHLLYIARSQDKLGQLVEAAENYRLLDHYTLPSGAPDAWVSAVDDGRKELATLEPRIPTLRIVADPADLHDPVLKIDDNAVAAAVIGISRPVDPGKHHIELGATGFTLATADVDVPEGATKDVTLKLAPGAVATPSPDAAPSDLARATSSSSNHAMFGFMAGLRLAAAVPTGKIYHSESSGLDHNVTDAFQPGGALELHIGLRIAQYFTPVLYFEGESLTAGDGFIGAQRLKNPTASAIGFGLIVGTPPGKIGGFGEIDLVPANTFDISSGATGVGNNQCDITAHGGAIRFGGGGVFPVVSWLNITPFAMATVGRFTTIDTSGGGCKLIADDIGTKGVLATDDVRTHGMVLLGVGGDIVVGRDRSNP